ncbi:MAG: hypothetical protein EOM67_10945 [Spirochaetia bacterium]|nr:hypothetical protein [Spirochaetia bacterium]
MNEYSEVNKEQPLNSSSTRTSVFTKEFIEEALKVDEDINIELLKETAVTKPPSFSLEECLLNSTKDVLLEMSKEHGLTIPSSLKKKEVAVRLKDHIIKRFHSMLEYLPTSNLNFLHRFVDEKTSILDTTGVQLMDISHTTHLGFLFLFYHKNKVVIVIPKELSPFLGVLKDKTIFEKAHLHERIDSYAVSLSNLYGVLDIDQAAIVWNKYEKETLTPMMIGDELSHLNATQIFWWYENEYIISTYFDTSDEVEEFLQSVKEVSYYMPSFEELRQFFSTPYDKSSPAAHAMIDFLRTFPLDEQTEVQYLMQQISDACVVGEELPDVIELLNEYGLSFHATDEVTRFTQLYDDLEETSRIWKLKGHRPSVLKNIQHI